MFLSHAVNHTGYGADGRTIERSRPSMRDRANSGAHSSSNAGLFGHTRIAFAGTLNGSFRVFYFGAVVVLGILEQSHDGEGAALRDRYRLCHQPHLTLSGSAAWRLHEGDVPMH